MDPLAEDNTLLTWMGHSRLWSFRWTLPGLGNLSSYLALPGVSPTFPWAFFCDLARTFSTCRGVVYSGPLPNPEQGDRAEGWGWPSPVQPLIHLRVASCESHDLSTLIPVHPLLPSSFGSSRCFESPYSHIPWKCSQVSLSDFLSTLQDQQHHGPQLFLC